jgi:hypothetical protein
MPLVNELVIGLPMKDRFNNSDPANDVQFAKFVTKPTLPELVEILFGVPAPDTFPRDDLISIFLSGIRTVNAPASAFVGTARNPDFVLAEMMRLNTSIAARPLDDQSRLGALGLVPSTRFGMSPPTDTGYPNGRRPGDDVVDISLRAAQGALLPAGSPPLVDGAVMSPSLVDTAVGSAAPNIQVQGCAGIVPANGPVADFNCATAFGRRFPYLNPPIPGDLQP